MNLREKQFDLIWLYDITFFYLCRSLWCLLDTYVPNTMRTPFFPIHSKASITFTFTQSFHHIQHLIISMCISKRSSKYLMQGIPLAVTFQKPNGWSSHCVYKPNHPCNIYPVFSCCSNKHLDILSTASFIYSLLLYPVVWCILRTKQGSPQYQFFFGNSDLNFWLIILEANPCFKRKVDYRPKMLRKIGFV